MQEARRTDGTAKAIDAPAPEVAMPAAAPPLDSSSLWVLVAVNLVPVAGVAFWKWSVVDLVYLYWIETLLVAVFTVLRMLTADSDSMSHAEERGIELSLGEIVLGKAVLIGAFAAFFGFFTWFQGDMILSFFPLEGRPKLVGLASPGDMSGAVRHFFRQQGAGTAFLAIAAAHAYAFVRYLGDGEYKRAQTVVLFVAPFKRIIVTQVVVIAGGIVLLAAKSHLAAVLVFIAAKIGSDVYFHRVMRVE